MEGVPIGAFTNGIGVVTVVLIVFWMLATNRLHTHGEFERMERDHLREVEDLAHDRDEWRAEGRLKDQQIDEQGIQLRSLSEVGRTMQAVLQALHDLARSGGSKETTP